MRPASDSFVEHLESRQLFAVTVHYFNTPTTNGASQPSEIVPGPDGNLWFNEIFGSKIGRISSKGAVTLFSTTAGNAKDVPAGPDKNNWLTLGRDKKNGPLPTAGR